MNETHQAGTVAGCTNCREVVYEPGWYQMLRRLSEPEPRTLRLVCQSDHAGTKVPHPSPDAWAVEVPALATSNLGF